MENEKDYPNRCGIVIQSLKYTEILHATIYCSNEQIREKFGNILNSMFEMGITEVILADGARGT